MYVLERFAKFESLDKDVARSDHKEDKHHDMLIYRYTVVATCIQIPGYSALLTGKYRKILCQKFMTCDISPPTHTNEVGEKSILGQNTEA